MRHPKKWTLVQHSGFGYAGDPTFASAVEVRSLYPQQVKKVRRVRGMIFDSHLEAEKVAQKVMYPEGYKGLVPVAKRNGGFSKETIDSLRIFVPNRKRTDDDKD